MSNEIIFWTQLASIISFITALFVLYRVLVSQKDSTIQLLKDKNRFLSDQLKIEKEKGPDQLAEY
jgi:hypothetical protein